MGDDDGLTPIGDRVREEAALFAKRNGIPKDVQTSMRIDSYRTMEMGDCSRISSFSSVACDRALGYPQAAAIDPIELVGRKMETKSRHMRLRRCRQSMVPYSGERANATGRYAMVDGAASLFYPELKDIEMADHVQPEEGVQTVLRNEIGMGGDRPLMGKDEKGARQMRGFACARAADFFIA